MTMRVAGGILLAVGVILAFIVGAWGRSGFYPSQAPIILVLGLLTLGFLGAGLGMLRYRGSQFGSGTTVSRSLDARAFMTAPVAAPASAPAADPLTSAVDDATHDRPVRVRWQLELPSGVRVPVVDGLVVGRRPASAHGGPTAVLASDEVSASHARFTLDGDRLLVSDLGSTNGTVVVRPDGSEREAGTEPVEVQRGDQLELGTFVVRVSQGEPGT